MYTALRTRVATPAEAAYHPVYVRLLLQALERRQIATTGLLDAAGLTESELAASGARVSHEQLRQLVQAVQARCPDPVLAFEWGAVSREGTHGAAGTAFMSAKDLRQAIQTLALVFSLRSTVLRPRLVESNQEAMLDVPAVVNLDELHEFLFCAAATTLAQLISVLLGPKAANLQVRLPMREPAWAAQCKPFFAGPVRFGAKTLQLVLPRASLDLPSPTADALTYEAALRQCEAEAMALREGLAARVSLLLDCRRGAYPTLTEIAQTLGLSARSFSRMLQTESTSYQALLDKARQAGANRLLANTSLSVDDIAAELGYTDTSNFIRAFRRWSGCSPYQYRQAHGAVNFK
jgi:AraC-like DNA-binding protein